MIEKLLKLQKNAYCKYSNFPVSSIVVTKDNKEFYGVNVEDASYRAGTCAERVALFSMLAAGYKKGDVKEINVMISNGSIGTPCFVCRQMILELCDKYSILLGLKDLLFIKEILTSLGIKQELHTEEKMSYKTSLVPQSVEM